MTLTLFIQYFFYTRHLPDHVSARLLPDTIVTSISYGSGAMHYRTQTDKQEKRAVGEPGARDLVLDARTHAEPCLPMRFGLAGRYQTSVFMTRAAMLLLALWLSLTQPALAAQPANVDTLAKIRSSRVIVVGHRTASIPFSYLPGTIARPIGYSISICEHIVDALKARLRLPNLRTRYYPVQPDNRIALIANGVIDIECGSTTDTPARRKEVDFSMTTFVAATRVAVAKGGPLGSFRDLGGRRIAVTQGTTNEQVLEQFARDHKLSIELVRSRDHDTSYAAFRQGKADAVAMDDILLIGLMTEAGDQRRFEFMEGTLSSEPYGIMLKKNEPEFKAIVDKTINDMIDQGAMAKLYQQWFRSPIPPKRINLSLPFTAEMAKVLKLVR